MHRYSIALGNDGDYVILESLTEAGWTEHTRWLIPGT